MYIQVTSKGNFKISMSRCIETYELIEKELKHKP